MRTPTKAWMLDGLASANKEPVHNLKLKGADGLDDLDRHAFEELYQVFGDVLFDPDFADRLEEEQRKAKENKPVLPARSP